jgi:trk system potassium uptake protein TrkH
MVLSLLRNELRRLLHPNAVMPMKVNGNTIPTSQQSTLMAFFSLYMILCLFTYFVMILTGIDSTNSFTIALSCASNVGPTLGLEIGPTMSWSILPDAIKLLLSLLMLMGRLEIMSVIVIFTRSFWTDK